MFILGHTDFQSVARYLKHNLPCEMNISQKEAKGSQRIGRGTQGNCGYLHPYHGLDADGHQIMMIV